MVTHTKALDQDTWRAWVLALGPSLLYLAAAVIAAGVLSDTLAMGTWIFVSIACAAAGTLLMQRPPSPLKDGPGFAWNVTYLFRREAPVAGWVAAALQVLAVCVFLASFVAAIS